MPVNAFLLITAAAFAAETEPAPAEPAPTVIVVIGKAGEAEFGENFQTWAGRWEKAAEAGGAEVHVIGRRDESGTGDEENGEAEDAADGASAAAQQDRDRLQALLAAQDPQSPAGLWIVLIGHGTFDRRVAKFNLDGPDVAAEEFGKWLAPLKRPLAIINCSSSSAPFINRLSGENRVVVTATKSGYELNYARFGDYISSAIGDLAFDLDKDEQVSLLEAFLAASSQVAEFYESEGRLATEQALLDDNGDGLGTPAAFFRGVRAVKRAKSGASLDGLRAAQWRLIPSDSERNMPPEVRRRRDQLELQIAQLREEKQTLDEQAYFSRLEPVLIQLAELYEELEQGEADEKKTEAAEAPADG